MGILENYVKTISLQIKVIWDIVKIIQMCLPIPDKMRKQHGCLPSTFRIIMGGRGNLIGFMSKHTL